MSQTTTQFDQWALVEVYGHQKYAGRVSEQTIGGCNFVRVDIPATETTKEFTKMFGQGAIFSITPIEEDVARALAGRYEQSPVSVYELPADFRSQQQRITDYGYGDVDEE